MVLPRLFAAALVLGAVWSLVPEGHSGDANRSEARSSGLVGAASRAYVDPETGDLTSVPPAGAPALELSEQEIEMLSRSTEGLVQRRSANGAVTVDLGGRFRQLTVATIAADGTLEKHCVESARTGAPAVGGLP
jgi:hypothetical protein